MIDMAKMRRLNDRCRMGMGLEGTLVQSEGINALPSTEQSAIKEKVERFDNFNENNDPLGERDFGHFEHNGNAVIWKIDYYDPTMTQASRDPTDTKQTIRVLRIMLADEY